MFNKKIPSGNEINIRFSGRQYFDKEFVVFQWKDQEYTKPIWEKKTLSKASTLLLFKACICL